MVQLPRFFESSGVDQSLPMGVMSWSEVLQEPADLVEVWEHGRAIMQENGSKGNRDQESGSQPQVARRREYR